MTSLFDDDTLLVALSAALEPEDVEPGPHALAALDQALADRAGAAADHGLAMVVPIMAPARRSSTRAGLHRLRHPVAAAVAVGVLATSGVAAAGVATDRLPGPTRTVAYDLGLPVTSPALEGTRGTMDRLRQALTAHNVAQVNASAVFLRTQLAGLSPSDRAQVEPAAAELLAQADTFLRVAAAFGFPVGTPGGSGPGTSGPPSTAGAGTPGQRSNGGTASTHGGSTPGPTEAGGTTPGTSGSSGSSSGGTTTGSGSPTTTGGPPETTPTTAPAGSTTTTTTTTGSTTTTTHPHRERDDGSDS
jgi:hypothetical protein